MVDEFPSPSPRPARSPRQQPMLNPRHSRLPARSPMIAAPPLFVERRVGSRRADDRRAHEERALLARALDILAGGADAEARLAGILNLLAETVGAQRAAVLANGADATLRSEAGARAMLLGGAPLDGERHIWWNFVASSPERIAQAKRDWAEDRFARVPGDDERIPLPAD